MKELLSFFEAVKHRPSTSVNWLLALMIVGSTPVFAQGAGEVLSSGELGLAQPLHWGMTVAEAKQALPVLDVAPGPGGDPRLAKVGTVTVPYLGCSLAFTLSFFRDQLDHVQVRAANGDGCHETIERDLTAHYSDLNIPAACPNIIHRQWNVPGTKASYNYACVPPRGGMSIDFYELSDLSGRQAEATLNYNRNCQLIFAEVLQTGSGDGATDPALTPDLPDFGCDSSNYPPISVRLQEGGSPILVVRVGTDGSVKDAQLIDSGGKPRLGDAAITLAKTKLKFVPSIRDGMAVEAVRQIRVTYRILNPIRGIGDFASPLYTCKDGSVQPYPCYGPFPALNAAPATSGAKLIVKSSDIKVGTTLSADFTGAGANKSPALSWTAGPAGTQSYVVIAEDPNKNRPNASFVFWMVLDIPASATTLPQGIPNDLRIVNPTGAVNVRRAFGGEFGYSGDATRPIHFEIFALDEKLSLDPVTANREDIIAAMKGHVLASGEIVANEAGK